MPAPSSKRPGERYFVVDIGASMHMLRKKSLSSGELETLRKSRKPATEATANDANEGGSTIFCHDLDLLVTLQILEDASRPVIGQNLRRARSFQ